MENNLENQEPPVIEIERKKKHRSGRLWWPMVLILVGVILLIQNLNIFSGNLNWWAAFIFIPAIGSLASAGRAFSKSGKFDAAVRSNVGSALVLGTLASMLLFDANWSKWWPLMVIAPGISMFLGGISGIDAQKHKNVAALVSLNLWVGAAVILLGIGFLAKFLPIPAIDQYLIGFNWWAIPILIAGAGALFSALLVFLRQGFGKSWVAWIFVGGGLIASMVGLIALFNLKWELLNLGGPAILILTGLLVLSGLIGKKE